MKIHLFPLFLITLLPLLVACDGTSTLARPPQIALDDSKLQFVSIENIGSAGNIAGLLEANITPPISEDEERLFTHFAVISPDGERIVFQRSTNTTSMICVYQFSTNATICTDMGERILEFWGGFWSPDGRYLVLNMDLAMRFSRDADILLYDIQENRVINRTDDGVSYNDNFVDEGTEEIRAKIMMDIAPIWSPNGDLYFFRNTINITTNGWYTDLMRISADNIEGTSTPEVILRHPSDNPFTVYRTYTDKLDGIMSISPNGKYLAYHALTLSDPDDPNDGIWIIDLTQKSVKIHLPHERIPAIVAGVPVWWGEQITDIDMIGMSPHGLGWSADSNRLVVFVSNFVYYPRLFIPPLKYDVTTDTLESFYDYSNVVYSRENLTSAFFDDMSMSTDNNQAMSILSPTHKTVFYIGENSINEEWVLSAMPVTESGFVIPRRIASLADFEFRENIVTSIGYSGSTVRILTGNNLITLTEQ